MRAWVIGFKRRIDATTAIGAAFDRAGVAAAAEQVDALMCIVACGATRTLHVDCVCHETLSPDEWRLLTAAALHQAGRGLEAQFVLRTMLSPSASRDAGEILDRLGAALGAGSLLLPIPPRETERFAFDPSTDMSQSVGRPTLH
jgi:hypothetical protein